MTIHRTAGWENVWLSLVNQKKQSNHVELSEYRYVSHSHSVLKMKASKLSENLSYQVGIDFGFLSIGWDGGVICLYTGKTNRRRTNVRIYDDLSPRLTQTRASICNSAFIS